MLWLLQSVRLRLETDITGDTSWRAVAESDVAAIASAMASALLVVVGVIIVSLKIQLYRSILQIYKIYIKS